MRKRLRQLVVMLVAQVPLLLAPLGVCRSEDLSKPPAGPSILPEDIKNRTPEALTLTYGPSLSGFKPYVGTGLAYSLILNEKQKEKDLQPGVAGHLGFQYEFSKGSLLNFNYKYLYMAPDMKKVKEGTTPQLLGIGLDLKF